MDRRPATVYLLHLDQPYQHARHYTSNGAASSRSLKARPTEYEKGQGARLLQVVKAAGIAWTLARTWPGDRKRERQFKAHGGASRRCPQCGG